MLAGGERPFDEARYRDLVRRDVERAHNIAAAQNHDVIADGQRSDRPLSAITAPTLVVHGTADPLFPIEHGRTLAAEIPDARFLALEGAGHGVDQADWTTIADAIGAHTASTFV